jgi:hypothetical protein
MLIPPYFLGDNAKVVPGCQAKGAVDRIDKAILRTYIYQTF